MSWMALVPWTCTETSDVRRGGGRPGLQRGVRMRGADVWKGRRQARFAQGSVRPHAQSLNARPEAIGRGKGEQGCSERRVAGWVAARPSGRKQQ